MSKVYIAESSRVYEALFLDNGFDITNNPIEADLVCFTGGADVSPSMYGELPHKYTQSHMRRDKSDVDVWDTAMDNDIPMVGICRGSQFLNVMSGGSMWQHVDNHAMRGTHPVRDDISGEMFECTSTHHQMMRPNEEATIIGTADLSTVRYSMIGGHENKVERAYPDLDIEVVTYQQYNVLCFQPHPEITPVGSECQSYFFKLLERELGVK